MSYTCRIIATYNGSPFFLKLASFTFTVYLLCSQLGYGHKMCITTGFTGKADCMFVAYTLQSGPVLC